MIERWEVQTPFQRLSRDKFQMFLGNFLREHNVEWRGGLVAAVRTGVFAALKVILGKSDHNSSWLRSLGKMLRKALGLLEEHVSILSPTNMKMENSIETMSWKYTKKGKGPGAKLKNTTRNEQPLFIEKISLWVTSSKLDVVEWHLQNPELRSTNRL